MTILMTRVLAFGLLAAGLLTAGGCQREWDIAPAAGQGDPYPAPYNDPQITVHPPEMREWLGFQPAYVRNEVGLPMQVELPVRNLTEKRYFLDYRFIFYDEHGMEIEPVMGWDMVAMLPKQNVRLKGGSLTPDAGSYRVEIKWAR